MKKRPTAGEAFDELVRIMDKLRDPGGCPWDREQTHASLRKYLVEEAAEVLEALDKEDMPHLSEEMGDLLLQIVFHSRIAREDGHFDIVDVVGGINDKMTRRHPHVFGDVVYGDADEVLRNWEVLKAAEKPNAPKHPLGDLPPDLPALQRAQKTGGKAARHDFDWPDTAGVLDKVREELGELEQALAAETRDQNHVEEEFGDLLFTLVNLARHVDVDAERALSKGVQKFRRRFERLSEHLDARNLRLEDLTPEEKEAAWQTIKKG